MKKKFVSIITLLILLFLNIHILLTPIFSVENENNTYTEKYKTGKYYENLNAYTPTGDNRFDVISVALTQLGYREGNSVEDFDGYNLNGTGNFVEYNSSYGYYDSILGYGYDWCASFVTWCLRQANVSKDIAPGEISCHRMIKDNYQPMNKYQDSVSKGGNYVPKTADIIFFEPASKGFLSNHVGLVIGVKDGKVYTIEGNCGNTVALNNYLLSDTYIVGYGTPEYNEITGVDYSLFDLSEYKLGNYIVIATDSLNLRAGQGTSFDVLKILKREETVTVEEIYKTWCKITYEGVTGWVSISYLISEDEYANYYDWLYINYNSNGGINPPSSLKFLENENIVISTAQPTRTGYEFLGWSLSDTDSEVNYIGGEIIKTNKSMVLYAVWEPTQYTVTFLNYDGTTLSSKTYHINDEVEIPKTPTRASDEIYDYVFSKWSIPVSLSATGSATYTAIFDAIPINVETTTEIPNTTESQTQDTITETIDIPAVLDTFVEEPPQTTCKSSSMIFNFTAAILLVGSIALVWVVKKN